MSAEGRARAQGAGLQGKKGEGESKGAEAVLRGWPRHWRVWVSARGRLGMGKGAQGERDCRGGRGKQGRGNGAVRLAKALEGVSECTGGRGVGFQGIGISGEEGVVQG